MKIFQRFRQRRDRARAVVVKKILQTVSSSEQIIALVRDGKLTEAEGRAYGSASAAAAVVLSGVPAADLQAIVRAFGDGVPSNERLCQMLTAGEITVEQVGLVALCLADARLRENA